MRSCRPTQNCCRMSPAGPFRPRHEIPEQRLPRIPVPTVELLAPPRKCWDGIARLRTSTRSRMPRPSTLSMTCDGSGSAAPSARAASVSPGAMRFTQTRPVQTDSNPVAHIKSHRLPANASKGILARHVADANNNRRQNQRHHDHLQRIEEQSCRRSRELPPATRQTASYARRPATRLMQRGRGQWRSASAMECR